jgi:hypothetical protein
MRYRIGAGGWPVGQYHIPAGAEIDESRKDLWSDIARGHIVPLNITALDDEAAAALAVQQQRQRRGG